jgi:hypothetical protein
LEEIIRMERTSIGELRSLFHDNTYDGMTFILHEYAMLSFYLMHI